MIDALAIDFAYDNVDAQEVETLMGNAYLPQHIGFDSYMLADDDLVQGGLRLLEVDNKVFLPIDTTIRLLITSADVLHS